MTINEMREELKEECCPLTGVYLRLVMIKQSAVTSKYVMEKYIKIISRVEEIVQPKERQRTRVHLSGVRKSFKLKDAKRCTLMAGKKCLKMRKE